MSELHASAEQASSDDGELEAGFEEASFAALADYLEDLQQGRAVDAAALVRERPELKSALRCLEALERFAQTPGLDEAAPPADETPTVTLSDTTPAKPPAREAPRTFGQYELLAELGRGGMGVVYQARQKHLGRTVALKMVLASHLASAQQLRRFEAEGRAAASLRHANIVRLLDSGQVEGQPYLAMDYIAGENLARRLQRGPLDMDAAVRLVCDVARAVDYLHKQGIVHRDVKPSNILLDEDGQPYLTDFGLAKLLATDSHLTGTGVAAGTPSYMAPEQAAGQPADVTPLCDVYSLGAVLYELLAGRPPFQAASAIDVLIQVLESEPVSPRHLNPAVPRSLATICLKCLEKQPAARYASAGALADDLERYLKGEEVEARSGGAVQRVRRWMRREPALASRLGVFTLFYLVEATYYLLGRFDGKFHYSVTAILSLWVAASFVCQKLMNRNIRPLAVPFVWGLIDAGALLYLLLIADGAASPLLIGYPLLVVAAGLWFRVRLVWFMTALSVLSYLVLVVDCFTRRPELKAGSDLHSDDFIYFVVGLIAMGAAVAYQVERVRALSRYYERRRPTSY
ncbi:MAG TPA: serine/threonine-protein kinase [Pirellulales bacterium]|nr:serine/threonine-protein kinase [Pirellulales bacterium]